MKKQVKRYIGSIVLGLGLATLGFWGQAYAGSCEDDTTCTFHLTNSNVTELNGNIDIHVTWDNTGTNTVLTVEYISGGPGTPGFINEFGYNSATLTTDVNGGGVECQTCWNNANNVPAQVDGFGKFASDYKVDPNQGIGPFTFTLAGLITNIPENNDTNRAEFVVHIGGFEGGCSGFVSDGTSSDTSSKPECGGTVPEPASLMLLGAGLAGIGIRQWAKRKSIQG